MTKPRFKIIPEVHLVLRKGDRFLMLRRFQTGYMDGHYSVVAGHVDGGETFRAAMTREAREEAGIAMKERDLTLVHTMHRRSEDERLSLFFEATQSRGEIRNMEPHKCDDLGWFSLAEQDKGMVPYVRSALLNITEGAWYSEFGWDSV